MAYIPTDEDLRAIKQTGKDVFLKIELLNKNFKIIDSLTGNLISDTLDIDRESKQRRTYNCTLHVTDHSFTIGEDKKIWIDKYIRVYYGIQTLRTNKVLWWLIGTFTYVDTNYTYSAIDNTLSLTCADLMADYDGTKNGQIEGYSFKIPAGEDIRQTVLALIKKAGITHYQVEDIGKEIPYDLEYNNSITYCDLLTDICNLYDSWEFFFDPEGTFIWRQVPTGYSDVCVLDDSFFDDIYLSESTNSSFKGIYNVTEVWGKVLDLEHDDRYASTSTFTSGIYNITLDGIASLDDLDNLDQIGIRICSDSTANAKVSINNLSSLPIVNDDGTPITANRLKANTDYVFLYRRTLNGEVKNCLFLMGQYQAYGIYKETNPDCPFSVDNLGYEIIQRLNYEKLYSDDLCYNQAEYLTYQTTAMMDTINLLSIIVPWIDVNQKIEYTSKVTGKTEQYIIQKVSWSSLEGIMNMTLYRFLESFSYVKNKVSQKERRVKT